jgi:hypothetical protein
MYFFFTFPYAITHSLSGLLLRLVELQSLSAEEKFKSFYTEARVVYS